MKPKLFTLSNGLKVVLEQNSSAPVISLNALIKVGSADETDDEAGLCHVIEHMLFKGTKKRKVGEIARDVEIAGGEINAYTSFDQTVYYINMAKRFVDQGMDILADAIQNPTFEASELEREKEVILEEIRRERDNPGRHVGEILFQKAFKKHPYGRPIIGLKKTVKSFGREALFRFYQKWYVPQNTTFILVGDFDPKPMLKKIETAFLDYKSDGRLISQTRSWEPKQKELILEIGPDDIQSLYFALGFHIPHITHEDIPALDCLSHILGGTTSSRLEQTLKEKRRLVQSIYAHAYTPKDPGLLLVGGHCNASQAGKAFQAFWEEIEKLKDKGPDLEELKRSQLNIKAHEIYEKETVGGQAGKLAYFLATAGDIHFEERYYEKLEKIKIEDVTQAAKEYLTPANLTAAILAPKKDYQKEWCGLVREALTRTAVKKKKADHGRWTLRQAQGRPKKIMLPNGVKLILKENRSLPIVAMSACFLGGLIAETKKINGIHHLMAQCITKGTAKRTALEVAKAVEDMAGQMEGFSGKNSFGLRLEILSEYLNEGLDLFFEVLLKPAFDPQEVEKEKRLTLEAIRNQEDNLSALAFYHFQKTLFPHHPYGMRVLGEKESIKNLKPLTLKNWHEKIVSSKNMVIALVGDFNPNEILSLLKKKLALFPRHPFIFKRPQKEKRSTQIQKIQIQKKKEQAHCVLGFLGPSFKGREYYTMTVLNNILSGMGGRLFIELRDKLSLAYAVTSVFQPGIDPGFFAVYLGTEPSKVPLALQAMEKELKRITTDGVTKEELEKTKNHLVGTYELELQRNSGLAQMFAFDELYGLGFKEVLKYPEKILKVTEQDLLNAAKKYIDWNTRVVSIVG